MILDVSGRSKAARKGRIKSSHFEMKRLVEGCGAIARHPVNESTQSELATNDHNLGRPGMVSAADRAGTEHRPGHGAASSGSGPGSGGDFKCSHFDPRLRGGH